MSNDNACPRSQTVAEDIGLTATLSKRPGQSGGGIEELIFPLVIMLFVIMQLYAYTKAGKLNPRLPIDVAGPPKEHTYR